MDPRAAYQCNEAKGANNPVHLVTLLYEQAVHDLQRAVAAISRNDIEARTSELDHALLVIGQLQATLDLERGADVAHNLDRFYGTMSAALMEAQVKGSSDILKHLIATLLSMREAWLEVERAEQAVEVSQAGDPPQPPGLPRTDWSA